MQKKLITACLALVALAAFALPATASATNSPELVENGARVATGTKILATNVGTTYFKDSEGNNILTECTTAKMTGSLTKNDGANVEGNITAANFEGEGEVFNGKKECKGTFGNLTVTTEGVTSGTPYCLRSTSAMATDEFQIRGGLCTEEARKITFIFDTTILGGSTECKYERTAAIKGTFTTSSTESTLSVAANANSAFTGEAGNSFICPSGGTLQMTFHIETDTSPFTKLGVL